jgi:4-aminobutyrate aminotransferase-like enzyme
LSELKKRYPEDILNVRGLGLMNGIEFNRPVAKKISKECFKRNLLLLKCSTYETLRFIPALNITQKELKEGLDIFEEAVHAVLRP